MPHNLVSDEEALLLIKEASQGIFTEDLTSQWLKIFAARPQLKNFVRQNASMTLAEYGKSLFSTESKISNTLKEIVTKKTSSLFGTEASEKASKSLDLLGNIDTSSHGGIFSEDTLVQSHLVIASGASSHQSSSLVSLACGVVPMNNATWPRGFFRLGNRESLFPKSFDRIAVHECSTFTKEHIDKRLDDASIDSCTKEIYESIKSIPQIFEHRYFFDQMTVINHELWKRSCSISGVSQFYHLLLEDITAELVIKSIESKDALSKLIFCADQRAHFMELFSNLPGTWSLDKKKGTFLFWASTGDFRAASVWPSENGASLVTAQRTIPFTEEEIKIALEKRELVPSVFLSLVTLLLNGVRPSGGYHQIAYLPEYAKRLEAFSAHLEEVRCPLFLGQMQTADLFQLGYGFTFIKDAASSTGFAGIDTLICNPISKEDFTAKLESTSVAASLLGNSSRLFSEIVPKNQQ